MIRLRHIEFMTPFLLSNDTPFRIYSETVTESLSSLLVTDGTLRNLSDKFSDHWRFGTICTFDQK